MCFRSLCIKFKPGRAANLKAPSDSASHHISPRLPYTTANEIMKHMASACFPLSIPRIRKRLSRSTVNQANKAFNAKSFALGFRLLGRDGVEPILLTRRELLQSDAQAVNETIQNPSFLVLLFHLSVISLRR